MTLPDLFCDAFRVLLITQMIHSPFTVPSAKNAYTELYKILAVTKKVQCKCR